MIQLILVTIYFTFFSSSTRLIRLIHSLVIIATVGIVFIISKYDNTQIKSYVNKAINKFRSIVIG